MEVFQKEDLEVNRNESSRMQTRSLHTPQCAVSTFFTGATSTSRKDIFFHCDALSQCILKSHHAMLGWRRKDHFSNDLSQYP